MEQNFKILINNSFSATTENIDTSSLIETNNYLLNSEGENDKLTDESNIRGFLEHEKNQTTVKGFYSFLSGSPTMNEVLYSSSGTLFKPSSVFKDIYYNDKKLSNVFNDYYNSIVRNSQPQQLYINKQMVCEDCNNQEILVYDNYFKQDIGAIMYPKFLDYIPLDITNSVRNQVPTKEILSTSKEDGYYINFFLQKSSTPLLKDGFKICEKKLFSAGTFTHYVDFNQTEWGEDSDERTQDLIERFSTNIEDFNGLLKSRIFFTEDEFDTGTTIPISNSSEVILDYEFEVSETGNIIYPVLSNEQIVQCFVNLNLSIDENASYAY